MFVRYFMELGLPFEDSEPLLVRDPTAWLPGLVEETDRQGATLLSRVGFGRGLHIRRLVEVTVGEPLRVPGRTVLPIRWTTGAEHSLLPAMEGDIELAPFGPGETHLAMSGRYTPPFGALGEAMDRALLNRVAEATVRDFVRRVGAAILAEASKRLHPSALGAGASAMSP
jgi:hypothetical protein